jgi:transcriptional regulator with XRE-family HTH domain
MAADDTQQRRAEIARRLKAARWLAGDTQLDGKGKRKPAALSPQALAARSPLPENSITASLIGSIERMERHTPPMELDALAAALGVTADYFSAEAQQSRLTPAQIREAAELLAPQLLEAARALVQASGSAQPGPVALGRPAAGEGGAGG